MITNTQAKKKCHERAIDSHCGPGSIIHGGNVERTYSPPSPRVTPRKPVVSNSLPKIARDALRLAVRAFMRAPISSTGGVPLYDDLPKLSAG